MKKFKLLFAFLALVSLLMLFVQCERDHTGTVHVSCYYLTDENDTLGPISGVWVQADTSRLSPNITVDSIVTVNGDTMAIQRTNYCNEAIRNAFGYTGSDGKITFQFPQPVLLAFDAIDTLKDVDGNDSLIYKGRAEVLIKDGAEEECPIYLTPFQ